MISQRKGTLSLKIQNIGMELKLKIFLQLCFHSKTYRVFFFLAPPYLTKSQAHYKFLYLENFRGGQFQLYRAWNLVKFRGGQKKKNTLYIARYVLAKKPISQSSKTNPVFFLE